MRWALPLLLMFACLAWLLLARFAQPRGTWLATPVLAATLLGSFAANELRWESFEGGLAAAVQPVTEERDASFACERVLRNFFSSAGYAGHVRFDGNGEPMGPAFLSMDTCAGIKAFRADPAGAGIEEINRVHILAHEAAHLAGVRDEAKAECLAMRWDAEVMRRLGATVDVAERAAQRYAEETYPRMPAEYRTQCPSLDQPSHALASRG